MDGRSRGSLERVEYSSPSEQCSPRRCSEARIWPPMLSPGRHMLRPQGLLRHSGALGCGSSDRLDARYGPALNGAGHRHSGGTLTPPMGPANLPNVSEMTRHLSLTKLKDITMSLIPGRFGNFSFSSVCAFLSVLYMLGTFLLTFTV